MTVSDSISILQQHDPAAVVVLSTGTGPVDVVAVERADVCAVQLRAIDDEYRKLYAVVVEDGVAGVWLG